MQAELLENNCSSYLLEMKERGWTAEEAKPREHKKILAAGESTLLPMKAMKLEVIVRHRDSRKPRVASR